jgi:hypothetical protein
MHRSIVTPEEQAPPPNLRFAPGYYFQQAFKILTWDDSAVRRASRDNNSLVYGFLIVAIGTALPFGLLLLQNWGPGYAAPWRLVGAQYALVLIYSLLWIVLQIGFSHVLARVLFEAKGSYLGIMRAYMLGQLFRWLVIIPMVGGIFVAVGGVAVLMMAFEEVDEIERMKAFGLAAAIGITFWILSIWIATSGPRPIR